MHDYHVWEVDAETQVRWHGGSQVNVYSNDWQLDDDGEPWTEVDVWSLSEWWETKPTLAEVDAAVRYRYNLRTCDECGRSEPAHYAPDWSDGICEECENN